MFDNCNLLQAIFDHTVLEKADFRTSYNYSIDPEINRMKKARFSISGISGLLDKYDIDIEKWSFIMDLLVDHIIVNQCNL